MRPVPPDDTPSASRHPWCCSTLVALAAAAVLAACGDDGDGGEASADCAVAEAGEVTIVADDLEWEPTCLEGPAGEPLTIVIDNQDDGVAHNLSIDAPGDPATDLETGPVEQELEVTLDAGEYPFVCDIHPNMVGTLRMVEAS